MRSTRAAAAVLAACAITGAVVLPATSAHATATDDDVARVAAARPCGGSTEHNLLYIAVYYRHCTSGSDSVTVKAIINNGADGKCTKVEANKTKEIAGYQLPSSFDRIVRC